MSKREHEQLTGLNEVEGRRTKRRREAAVAISHEANSLPSDPAVPESEDAGQGGGPVKELIQEEGLKLWQTVKDAVNKEGRTLSLDFLRRPSKRQYPDYYRLIQQPIALDEIKKKLDNGDYPSLEAVKDDFELCFNNAKQYNMKDSVIWSDAKELLKLVNKAYSKMTAADEDGENADGDGKGKSKSPNLTRLIKSRLQKLVDKTDETGRVLSTEFMELPSRKEWAIYYKTIKRPQCLENIFKRIKRKEYYDAGEFAADVELVFANALSFNQEHTLIWEDARTLRDYFRHLMSDMPPPYALAEYTKPSNGKIKIKMPAQPVTSPSILPTPASPAQPPASSALLLRVPASNQAKPSPESTPIVNNVPAPVVTATLATPVALHPVTTATTSTTVATQPIPYVNNSFSHYPNAPYIPPAASSTPSSTSNLPISDALPQTHSASRSPAPSSNNPLKSTSLTIQPSGRSLELDYRDGVKCWAMRLVPGETEVHVARVVFLDGEEEEESSGEEEDNEADEGLNAEEEQINDVSSKTSRKKGRGKGKGRPKMAKGGVRAKATPAKKKKPKTSVHVTLNGTLVKAQPDTRKWVIQPSIGMNVLEVGESGGLIWKVYIQRSTL